MNTPKVQKRGAKDGVRLLSRGELIILSTTKVSFKKINNFYAFYWNYIIMDETDDTGCCGVKIVNEN